VLGGLMLVLVVIVIVQNLILTNPELRGSGRIDHRELQAGLRGQASEIAALKSTIAKMKSRIDGLDALELAPAQVKSATREVQQQPRPRPQQQQQQQQQQPQRPQQQQQQPQRPQQQQQPTSEKIPAASSATSATPTSSSSRAKYFTVSNAPCKDGAAKLVQAGICRAPSQRPKEQCSIELVAGATTYGVDLPTTIGNRPFWTKAQDEFGKRTVHINTHDPVTEDQYISKSILDNGVWDEYILKIFQHVLLPVPKAERRSKLVVDVGANIAYFSLTAASYGFRTVSFEPMRFNLARILSSIERNPGFSERMIVYNMAVSNSVGALSLKATATTNAGNFAVQANKQSTSDSNKGSYGSDYVNSASLDEIIDEDILLMKIDVETFEPFVLDGARNLLCQNIVQHIIIEFDKNQRSAHGGACPPDEMMGWMDKLGYDVRDVIVGAPKINIRPLNVAKMPPNVWFSLRDISMSPAKRMEAGDAAGVCEPNNTRG
jgi:FkbM family methyltransferase